MTWPIFILILTQAMFTVTDLLGRTFMLKYGFKASSFLSLWFILYFILRITASFGQLYIFSTIKLGKSMALFGAVSIILANTLGYLVLNEVLSPKEYIGISIAIIAFIFLATST
jgi:multidrug transporter EmrE-like cation transporter